MFRSISISGDISSKCFWTGLRNPTRPMITFDISEQQVGVAGEVSFRITQNGGNKRGPRRR